MSQTASLVSTLRGASDSLLGACCKSRSVRELRSLSNLRRHRVLHLHGLTAKTYLQTSDAERTIPIIQSGGLSFIFNFAGFWFLRPTQHLARSGSSIMGSTANNLYLCSDLLVLCKSGNHAVEIYPQVKPDNGVYRCGGRGEGLGLRLHAR